MGSSTIDKKKRNNPFKRVGITFDDDNAWCQNMWVLHYHFLNFYNFWWSNSSCFFLLQGLPWILKPSFYVVAPQECQSDRVPWDDTFCSWSSLHVCSSEKLSVLFITLFRHRTFSSVPSFLTSGPEFWEHLKVFCHSICKYSKKCSNNYFRTFEMFCNSI